MNQHAAFSFWNQARLLRISLGVAFSIVVGFGYVYLTDYANSSALKRGDFPSFYGPAVILARGEADRLYDPVLQRDVENEFWPSFAGHYYMSVYPPFVYDILTPLTLLGPVTAKSVFMAISLVLLALSIYLMGKRNSFIADNYFFSFSMLLCFTPTLFGVLGGQNTAISLALYLAAITLLSSQQKRSEFWGGVFLGLWLFKPQYGVFGGAYLILTRSWLGLLGYGLVVIVYYLWGVALLDYSWPMMWWNESYKFGQANLPANQAQMVSIAGMVSAINSSNGDFLSPLAVSLFVVSVILILLVLMTLIPLLIRSGREQKMKSESLALLGPAIILLSPQALFYDLSIVLASVSVVFKPGSDRDISILCLIIAVVTALTVFRADTSFSLLFPVGVLAYLICYRRVTQRWQN